MFNVANIGPKCRRYVEMFTPVESPKCRRHVECRSETRVEGIKSPSKESKRCLVNLKYRRDVVYPILEPPWLSRQTDCKPIFTEIEGLGEGTRGGRTRPLNVG